MLADSESGECHFLVYTWRLLSESSLGRRDEDEGALWGLLHKDTNPIH